MSRLFLWFRLLTKRHLARPAFWVILLLIPLFSGALALASHGESGLVTVALCPGASELGRESCETLSSRSGVLRFLTFEDAAQAREMVVRGDADAAWIFLDEADARLRQFVDVGTGAAVLVIEREDNVFLRIARERLYTQLYPSISWALFTDCADKSFDDASEALLLESYGTVFRDAPIFVMAYIDGSARTGGENYLTSPIRGLLALLVMLAALSASLGCCREEAAGCYDPLPRVPRRLMPMLSCFTAALPVALCSLPALAVAGLWTSLWRELAVALLLSAAAAGFSELVRTLCRKEGSFAAALPLLMLMMAALCPVFFGLVHLPAVQLLLPPFYGIHAAHTPIYLLWLALYTLAVTALTSALRLFGKS